MNDKPVEVLKVIRTELARTGDGVKTAIAPVTQFWTMDGNLLIENPDRFMSDRISDLEEQVNYWKRKLNDCEGNLAAQDADNDKLRSENAELIQKVANLSTYGDKLGDTVMNLTADLRTAQMERDKLRAQIANPMVDAGVVKEGPQFVVDPSAAPQDMVCAYCDLLVSEHTLEEWRACCADIKAGKEFRG